MKKIDVGGHTIEVFIHGNIYFNKKRLNKYDNGNGYLHVSINRRMYYVHRVVCEAFHGGPKDDKMQANHLNGIRSDNHARNLRWDTRSDNQKHAFRVLNRKHPRNQLGKNGFNHHYSKPVDQIDPITDKVIKTFGSKEVAAKEIGVDPSAIYNAIVGRNRVKMCRGFKWRYNPSGNIYKSKYKYYYENNVKKRALNT